MINLKDSAEARFWYLNLAALWLALLVGAVIGARLEPFLWLLVCRPLAAMAITLLPPTSAGDLRPYMLASTLLCLAVAQITDPASGLFHAAILGLFCLLDPCLDGMLVRHCPQSECLGRIGQLVLVRSCGLGLGLLAEAVLLDRGGWIFSGLLLALALLLALIPEGPDQRRWRPGIPRRIGTEVRFTTLLNGLAECRDRRLGGHLLVVFSVALLAGSFGANFFPLPMLTPPLLSEWLSKPGYWLGGALSCALLALTLERISERSLVLFCYPAMLCAGAASLAGRSQPALALVLEMACGLSLLVAFRQALAARGARDGEALSRAPCLRAALPCTVWALGLLAGQPPVSRSILIWTQAAAAVVVVLAVVVAFRKAPHRSPRPTVTEQELRHRGQSRHGDKTMDFAAAPTVGPKRHSRWLSRLWYFLSIRFPVTLTMAVLASFVLAGSWHVSSVKESWKQRTHGMWVAMKTQLFLTSLKHRTEEEMLVTNRVPTDWAEFIRHNFELDGRPMKDRDFWGTPLHFELLPKEVRIVSAGPDKKLATPDDLERLVAKPDGVR